MSSGPASARRLGRLVHVGWCGACVAVLVVLLGVRWLRYTSWSAAPGLDGWLRELMVVENQAFLWPWVYSRLYLRVVPVAAVVLLVGFHRRLPGQLVRRSGSRWRLTPIATALALGGMVWVQYAFDANPTVFAACVVTFALTWLLERPRATAVLPARVRVVLCAGALGWGLAVAGDVVDRMAVGVWALFLLATHRWAVDRMRSGDLALARVAGVMAVNLLSANLPIVVPMHGGTRLGDGLAYSFCEVPNRPTVYASIPVCDSVRAGYEDCRDGRVVEYDLRTMRQVASHGFFSPEFHGRLELLVCLDDEVQVAVQASVYRGARLVQSAMTFSVDSPTTFVPVVSGREIGTTIAWDRVHDAVFYSGEFTNRVLRFDRRTSRLEDAGSAQFLRRWYQPVSLEPHDGSLMLHTQSVHPGRNRIYLADWMQGRFAYALDLTTLEVVARYDVGGGGSLGISVDPERDRLFVSSVWGLEVVDLATDRITTRMRTGLGNRPVVVDAERNRLYLSSMAEGKIRILDRETLAVIGQIPVGSGTRYPYLTRDGRYLLASSSSAHFYWDADMLGRVR